LPSSGPVALSAPIVDGNAPVVPGVESKGEGDWAVSVDDAADDGWTHEVNGVPQNALALVPDAIGDVLGQAVVSSGTSVATERASEAFVSPVNLVTDKYVLPKGDLAQILGSASPALPADAVHDVAAVLPNVNCRVSLSGMVSLLGVLKTTDVSLNVETVLCDVFFPAGVAQAIADHLAGIVVDRRDVAAVMQRELAKLS
jgi:hypothetical protein